MNKTLSLLFLIVSTAAFAKPFCQRSQDDLRAILDQETSRISFENGGGIKNTGVCWWHARLQRSSLYLAKYSPKSPPPSPIELQTILYSLRSMNRVVTIPGFENFKDFSSAYQKEIQDLLDDWQKYDGVFNFQWIRGISGRSSLSPTEMKTQMDKIYAHYKSTPVPLWIMAQIRGIESHSHLVTRMSPRPTGYELSIIDSNHPLKTIVLVYNVGDRFLKDKDEDYSFVPYVGFQNDFVKINQALNKECRSFTDVLNTSDLRPGDVEL